MTAAGDWTTPADARAELERYWSRGDILAAALQNDSLFPLSLRLRRPNVRQLSEHFDEVRRWIRELEEGSKANLGAGYVIDWEDLNLRQLGRNRVPRAIAVPTEDDALRWLGKRRQMDRFKELAARTLEIFPVLFEWISQRPRKLLDHADDWSRIVSVLEWFRDHPSSRRYLRQIDVAEVDTKFIEDHKGLLGELLDRVLAAEFLDPASVGVRNFEQRYGLTSKPSLIRFRILDARFRIHSMSDIATPPAQFAELRLPVERVFITENEVNGLAFPETPSSIVIFGLGYGLQRLAEVTWLRERDVHYWGDIDTHGFAILDQLRARLPHARSLLMDRETLLAHRRFWVTEPQRADCVPARLHELELALYDDLVGDRLGKSVRLEQERVGFGRLENALRACAT